MSMYQQQYILNDAFMHINYHTIKISILKQVKKGKKKIGEKEKRGEESRRERGREGKREREKEKKKTMRINNCCFFLSRHCFLLLCIFIFEKYFNSLKFFFFFFFL